MGLSGGFSCICSSVGRISNSGIFLWTDSVAALEHSYCLCNTSDVTDEINSTDILFLSNYSQTNSG